MRLNEEKSGSSYDEEVSVLITVGELMILKSLMGKASESDIEKALTKDGNTNLLSKLKSRGIDFSYILYDELKSILKRVEDSKND